MIKTFIKFLLGEHLIGDEERILVNHYDLVAKDHKEGIAFGVEPGKQRSAVRDVSRRIDEVRYCQAHELSDRLLKSDHKDVSEFLSIMDRFILEKNITVDMNPIVLARSSISEAVAEKASLYTPRDAKRDLELMLGVSFL